MSTVESFLKKLNLDHRHNGKDRTMDQKIRARRAARLRQIACFLYLPYKWLVLVPVFILATTILSIVCVVLSILVSPKTGSTYTGPLWGKLICYLTPVFLRVRGKENIDQDRSYVIVSNHQSHFDIFIVYGWLGIDFKWVMKQSIRNMPGIGVACEKMEHIFIDRTNGKKAVESINRAGKSIRNGTSIFFFPEGTRSETGDIAPFKKGAFKLAFALNLPILPVTINGTNRILPKNGFSVLPGKAELIIHQPIDTAGYKSEKMPDLIQAVRSVITSAHAP
ncbi:MAG TPA: lysophospholipid acyltransferase family protein [Desulfobacteraceae bacterium]|nr:lysophospholipid acyltransferase family protein [Desulfobacteraceae bacterium]